MKKTLSRLAVIERVAVMVASLCLFTLMIIITVDVFLRYFLHRPLIFTHDIVTLYLMPTIFFLFLSDSMRAGAQVRVDIARELFPRRFKGIADAIGYLGAALAFALIAYGGFRQCLEALRDNEVVAGSIPWPVWPSFLLVAVGCAMLVARLLIATIKGFANRGDLAEDTNDIAYEEIE